MSLQGWANCLSESNPPAPPGKKEGAFFLFLLVLEREQQGLLEVQVTLEVPLRTFSTYPFLPHTQAFSCLASSLCSSLIYSCTHLPPSQRRACSKSIEACVIPISLFAYICMVLCAQGLVHHFIQDLLQFFPHGISLVFFFSAL